MKYVLIFMLTVAIPVVANARPLMDDEQGDLRPLLYKGKMPHAQHCNNEDDMFRFPVGLDLSEDRQDKIFSILIAQARTLHEQDKIVRNAYIDLHKLATSAQYDDVKAEAIIESLAKARAAIALVHAQEGHQIYALLTEEQRKALSMHGQSGVKQQSLLFPEKGSSGTRSFHIF